MQLPVIYGRLQIARSIADPWVRHRRTWQACTKCEISQRASNRVLARGVIPADVVFIGEAPGHDEDHYGKPFVGKSGRLLQSWINAAFFKTELTWVITNVIACLPGGSIGGSIRQPNPQEVMNCRPRLLEFMKLANPIGVVSIGRVAAGYALPWVDRNLERLEIYHPAYALRQGGAKSKVALDQIKKLRAWVKELERENNR